MNEEKDDFLREIDELLGDVEGDSTPLSPSMANGSTGDKHLGDVDLELEDTLKVLSVGNDQQQTAPTDTISKTR